MATLADTRLQPPVRRPRWLWPLAALGVLLYALLFGEMFLRLLKPQALVPRYVTGSPEGIRANIPGAEFRQWTPEVDVTIRYNAAGMRDDRPPPPTTKAPGECRVALLGDSYFVGFESDFEASYAAQLEQALKARGFECRVLNFAVSGFGTAEMLLALETRVGAYAPDLVIASVHSTDGRDNVRSGLFRLGPGSLERTGRPYLPGVPVSDRLNGFWLYRWAQENSHLYAAVREWAGMMSKALLAEFRLRATQDEEGGDGGETAEPAAGEALPAFVADRNLNRVLALALAREANAQSAGLLLVEIPTFGNRLRYFPVLERLLGPDLPMATASPLRRFEAMKGPETKLYLEKGHRHWTPLGNRVAAEATADAVLAAGLLERPA